MLICCIFINITILISKLINMVCYYSQSHCWDRRYRQMLGGARVLSGPTTARERQKVRKKERKKKQHSYVQVVEVKAVMFFMRFYIHTFNSISVCSDHLSENSFHGLLAVLGSNTLLSNVSYQELDHL